MFRRLEIPTPFQIGPVNAYLAGRTIVDPGPDSEAAWEALTAGLDDAGLASGDVERVLVTHAHPDHFGLAHRLRAAGADVLASPETAAIVADFRGRHEREREFFLECFQRHGMSAKTATSVTELAGSYLEYAPDVTVDRELADGDVVPADGTEVAVIAAEGHAPGERLFAYDAGGKRHVLVGDHVLAHITPNPLLQPPDEPGGERPRVLPRYNASLERLRERPIDLLRTGHGDDVPAPAERIDEILAAHEQRTANVLDLLEGPTTAVEVMEGLFGDLPLTEYFPAMSEALGHLDVLAARGAVERRERDGTTAFVAAD